MTAERWVPVPDYDGLYEVSDLGRVRSLGRRVRTWFGDRLHEGRVMNRSLKPHGYLEVVLQDSAGGRKPKFCTVHSIVARAFHGEAPSEHHEVCHNDGVRANCAASNLRWGTRRENMADQKAHGTFVSGPRNGNSTITQELADWIRESSQSGLEIHHATGVSRSTTSRIKRGVSYPVLSPAGA